MPARRASLRWWVVKMNDRAGCLRLLGYAALACVVVVLTRDLAPDVQLALAGAGFGGAVLTVVFVGLAKIREVSR